MENDFEVSDYKAALIEYSCDSCYCSENFEVLFSNIPRVRGGKCEHLNLNFLLSINLNEYKYLVSFTCKNEKCSHNEMKELFNKQTKDISGNIKYSCPKCGNGNMNVGFILENELINLEEQENDNNIQIDNKNDKIKLIFVYNNFNYPVVTERKLFISEAFSKLCEEYKDLKKLDIQLYKKGDNELSQYMSIEELNLIDNDKIVIQERPNSEWGN